MIDRVRLAAPADQVEALMGRWGSVEPIDDGDERECRMVLNTDTLDWPVMILANLDCAFTVEGPAELGELLERVGRRFVRSAEPRG